MKLKFLLGFFLFLFACSTIPKSHQQKEYFLKKNLQEWEKLRIDGIIEVNYKGFTLRKNIVLKKNTEAIRMDIFDSGILGISPTPYASAYFDTLLFVKMPGKNNVEIIGKEKINDFTEIVDFFFNPNLLLKKKKEILNNHQTETENLIIFFNPVFQIKKIEYRENNISALFIYEDRLTEISLWNNNKKLACIYVDNINFNNQNINKLNFSEKL